MKKGSHAHVSPIAKLILKNEGVILLCEIENYDLKFIIIKFYKLTTP